MSNSRQELESQNEIVIGLQAIAKQSKELMRQLRRPTGDKNLYNSLGQDIQRAEKKVKHLRQQENDIDAFQKTNQSLAETNKLLAASRKKSAALAMLTKDREPSQRSRFMNKEIAQVAETINALEKKRDLLAAIDKSQRHHLTQQGINLKSLGNERKNLRDGRIN
ncbi:TPA: phage tail tape measure protein, partial [Serratia marcescens]|nr:phage tail tape measure protein [Serratia marcescens]